MTADRAPGDAETFLDQQVEQLADLVSGFAGAMLLLCGKLRSAPASLTPGELLLGRLEALRRMGAEVETCAGEIVSVLWTSERGRLGETHETRKETR